MQGSCKGAVLYGCVHLLRTIPAVIDGPPLKSQSTQVLEVEHTGIIPDFPALLPIFRSSLDGFQVSGATKPDYDYLVVRL